MSNKIFQPGELHEGDFILFAGKVFISRGIEAISGSKWSHAAIYVGNDYVIEATETGVEKNLLTPLIKQAKHIAVMRIPNLSVDDMERMKAKAYAMLGDHYDFLNLLTLAPYYLLRKLGITCNFLVFSTPGSVICSELCAECAMVIPFLFAKLAKLVAPQTIYTNGSITKAYED